MEGGLGSPPAGCGPPRRDQAAAAAEPEPEPSQLQPFDGDLMPPRSPILPAKSPGVQERMRRKQLLKETGGALRTASDPAAGGAHSPVPLRNRSQSERRAPNRPPPERPRGATLADGGEGDVAAVMARTHAAPEDVALTPTKSVELYRTCLDRPFVQMEVMWARDAGKNIIVVYEREAGKVGCVDFGLASSRYAGTPTCAPVEGGKFAFLFSIDAIPFVRDGDYQPAFAQKILGRAVSGSALSTAPAGERVNEPGTWNFFLSHHARCGEAQVSEIQHLLEAQGKTCWRDVKMGNRSTDAMEEGVKNSDNFILMLTHDDQASAKAAPRTGGSGSGSVSGTELHVDHLKELVQLYKDGYLTESEFTRAKTRLLGGS